jgi:glycerate kinase
LVLTGEGRFDATSLGGKAPGALIARARRAGKAAHVFAGSLAIPEDRVHHAITPPDLPLAQALPRTAELLAAAVALVL